MSKTFRPWDVDQRWLLPPSVDEFVPEGHVAHFVRDTVRDGLDLSAIMSSYDEERGFPPYHPTMMTALLIYGYSQGVYSSRRIAKACEERLDFMAVTALNRPDFRTVSDFRKRHLKALSGLFVQVLKLCAEAGLVKLGHVAIDGTKIKANASKHKAMSYKRMNETEARLKQEIDALLATARRTDAEEDAQYGKDRRGDELPVELQRRESRLQKIGEAKAALEQEAKEKASQQRAETEQKLAEREEEERRTGKKKRGRKPQAPDPEQARPDDTAQRNFVDPESRIMPDGANKGSFVQGYNAQIAVDSASQVIVAAEVTQETNDKKQLVPMIAQMVANLEQKPEKVSADTGYFSEANVTDESVKDVDLYVATGRDQHNGVVETISDPPPPDASPKEAMRHKLRTTTGRAVYKMRKAIVEPVFGQIKEQRGFRRFSLRGLNNVSREWRLVCAASNLLKLFRAHRVLEMA